MSSIDAEEQRRLDQLAGRETVGAQTELLTASWVTVVPSEDLPGEATPTDEAGPGTSFAYTAIHRDTDTEASVLHIQQGACRPTGTARTALNDAASPRDRCQDRAIQV